MFGKKAEASGADQIKSCCVFTIPDSLVDGQDGTRFRDELSLSIADKLSGLLQAQGFDVTVASPASHGAVFYIKFDRFKVAVVLSGVTRVGGIVECSVITWCLGPPWRRVSPEVVANEWIRACAAIEETLRRDLNVATPLLLTEQEAESHWEKADRTYE